MSKRAQLSSQCICGAKLTLTVRKPKRLTPTFAKASCACGSRYLFECRLGADARSIDVTPKAITLSSVAKSAARETIREKANA